MAQLINGKLDLQVMDINSIIDTAIWNADERFNFTISIDGFELTFSGSFEEICSNESSDVYGSYYEHRGWKNGDLYDYDYAYDAEGNEYELTEESKRKIEAAVENELCYFLD